MITLWSDSYAELADVNNILAYNKQWNDTAQVPDKEIAIKTATQQIEIWLEPLGEKATGYYSLKFPRVFEGDTDNVYSVEVQKTRFAQAVSAQISHNLKNRPVGLNSANAEKEPIARRSYKISDDTKRILMEYIKNTVRQLAFAV